MTPQAPALRFVQHVCLCGGGLTGSLEHSEAMHGAQKQVALERPQGVRKHHSPIHVQSC